MVSAYYLNEALIEAKKADPLAVRPNPLVGAVLVDAQGEVVGRGYHQQFGGPHAEVNAFADALKNGVNPGDCTLFVTLEPCSHHGKTPPCTDLILQHGVKKVVIGSMDPNPVVSGVDVLKKNGVDVEVIENAEIKQLNSVFFINQKEKRPYFQFKMAMTSTGVYAHRDKHRLWLTGKATHRYVHEVLRSEADALLSTARSVINDNATLNVRVGDDVQEKTAIVLDQRLDLLKEENRGLSIFYPRKNSNLILVTTLDRYDGQLPSYVEILVVPEAPDGRISLTGLSKILYTKGYHSVLIEAGDVLYRQLKKDALIDECHFIIAGQSHEEEEGYLYFSDFEQIIALDKSSVNQKVKINELDSDRLFVVTNR